MACVWYEEKSPCVTCEHRNQDKKKFEPCVNCERRLGGGTCFQPDRGNGRGRQKQPHRNLPLKSCKWPWGCSEKTVKSDYCTEHQRLISDRRRKYLKRGMTEEEFKPLLTEPIRKGPNKDSLKAMRQGINGIGYE